MSNHADNTVGSETESRSNKSYGVVIRNNLIAFVWCWAIAVFLLYAAALDIFIVLAVPISVMLYIFCGYCFIKEGEFPSYLSVLSAPFPLALFTLTSFVTGLTLYEWFLALLDFALILVAVTLAPPLLILLGMAIRKPIRKMLLLDEESSAGCKVEELQSSEQGNMKDA